MNKWQNKRLSGGVDFLETLPTKHRCDDLLIMHLLVQDNADGLNSLRCIGLARVEWLVVLVHSSGLSVDARQGRMKL